MAIEPKADTPKADTEKPEPKESNRDTGPGWTLTDLAAIQGVELPPEYRDLSPSAVAAIAVAALSSETIQCCRLIAHADAMNLFGLMDDGDPDILPGLLSRMGTDRAQLEAVITYAFETWGPYETALTNDHLTLSAEAMDEAGISPRDNFLYRAFPSSAPADLETKVKAAEKKKEKDDK